MPPRRNVVRPIQYPRGIAAMMVVWHHGLTQVPRPRRVVAIHFGVHAQMNFIRSVQFESASSATACHGFG